MKSTGIVRHVDSLDRIVLPKELRDALGIEARGGLEIFVDGPYVVLEKHFDDPSKNPNGNIGIVRHVDDVGRIVIPKEICSKLGLEPKDSLEIFIEETRLILSKYEPACIFCGEVHGTVMYKKKLVCKKCVETLASII